jgi:hypothetical protein
MVLVGFINIWAKQKAAPPAIPKFSELSNEDKTRLDQQRAVVGAAANQRVMVTDEYGTDPTLRFKNTTVQINALTMISKRIERGEEVNLTELLRITRRQLTRVSEGGKL